MDIKDIESLAIVVPIILALVGAIFGIYQYRDKKEQEFKKLIWEERKSQYYEVLNYTAKIALAESFDSVENEVNGFLIMYYGRLALIEDAKVYSAMASYYDELRYAQRNDDKANETKLSALSLDLAICCRQSLQDTWEPVKFEDLGKLHKQQK